jgi:hypothetical protein
MAPGSPLVLVEPTPANPDDVREADLADLVDFLDDVVTALEQLARTLDDISR